MGPFDRFNDRAKRVLALAQDEAIRFNHNYIGPEHLLLGLVREGEGVAARSLDALGVQLSKVRVGVELLVGRGDSTKAPSEITLHPRTKKIVELAMDEARKLGHSHVGTEHLLLGIVREGEGGQSIASKVLKELGVELQQVRHQVVATLGQRGAAAQPPAEHAWSYDTQGRKRDWYCEDVLSGTTKVNVIWEDERVLAFHHPRPEAPIHGVAIPKRHVGDLLEPGMLDGELLSSMLRAVQEIARRTGIAEHGFQLRSNAIAPGVTPHVHWHVVGPGMPPPAGHAWPTLEALRTGMRSAPARELPAGMGPLSRFDEEGKRVLAYAQDEAIRLNHNYIGTEHLLAGVLREEKGIGAKALLALGVEVSKVRTALEYIIGRGDTPTAPSDITLSPRTKKVIELAIDEANKLGHAQVGSAHVLLGLVREGQGIASGILESLKVSLPSVRQKVLELMGRT